MRTIILLTSILLTATICNAQEEKPKTLFVNGKDINKLGIEFIEIAAYNTSIYGKKWGIAIDIGQEYVSWKGSKYRDEKGDVVDFDSPMH